MKRRSTTCTIPLSARILFGIPLGKKVSDNERVPFYAVDLEKYFTIRLDGKAFSTVLPMLKHIGVFEATGYSMVFEQFMQDLALYLTRKLAEVLYVFTQSDDITLLVDKCKQDEKGQYIARELNGRRDKLVSLASGLASSRLYALCVDRMMKVGIIEKLPDLPPMVFDARMAQYSTLREAFELVIM